MNSIHEHITKSLKNFPEFLRSKDLLKLGLYKSYGDIYHSKKRGLSPPHVLLGDKKIVYLKTSLIEWIIKKSDETNYAAVEDKAADES